ncbi:MAG: exopolyphosphatase [Nitrospinota bacterium]|nr:exopolyphosphatase [Nitrospinota bacterium]
MYNIITRGDFDGLACSVLLTEVEQIAKIRFAHPRDVQERTIEVTSQDIIVNLPYDQNCAMWFDHHISESERGPKPKMFKGKYGQAPSCARLVHDYYNKPEWKTKYAELMEAVDKIDSARLDLNDILRPDGWVKLAATVDPRSGFTPSYDYFLNLLDGIKETSLADILQSDDVRDRVREYFRRQEEFKKELLDNSTLYGKVVVTDFRRKISEPLGSRFLIYSLFPSANVALRLFDTPDKKAVVIAAGHSILNRTCKVDLGNLLAEYGGGGHAGAGSCAVPIDSVDDAVADITNRLT